MSNWKIKLSLYLNYFVFAILLNSVGTVILQVQNLYGVSPTAASVLEPFKDLSIAIFSFLAASYIPRFGYKKSMLAGLLFVTGGCIAMRLIGGFAMTKILFATIGVSFALIKISAYSTVGVITENADQHASVMSVLEGFFMVGMLSGYAIFGEFIKLANENPAISWLDTYWVLAAISFFAFLLLLSAKLDESGVRLEDQKPAQDFIDMIMLVRYPMVIIFIFLAFFYVLIEQSITTWLPTFNNKVLFLPSNISVTLTSILPGTIAAGRLLSGKVIKKFSWFPVLIVSIIGAMILVALTLPATAGATPGSVTGWGSVPIAAFILPLVGLFLAPIYPTVCSSVLSKLPKAHQSAMSGLIVIFSALGGTTGSLITGFMFGHFSGQLAFYLTLIPMSILLVILFPYRRTRQHFKYIHKTVIS